MTSEHLFIYYSFYLRSASRLQGQLSGILIPISNQIIKEYYVIYILFLKTK